MEGYRDPRLTENVEPMTTTARDVTRQRAASDILMQIVVRVGNLALGVVVTALLVRTLGRDGYGQWSTIFLILGLIAYFASFGMEEIAVREAAKEPEIEFEWIGAVMMLRLLVIVPVMIVSLIAVVLLHQSQEMLIAGFIMVLVMPFGGIGAIGLIFQLRVDNRIPMLVVTLRSVLWGAAVLVIYLDHGHILALAIALVATNMVGTIVQGVAARKVAGGWPRPTRKHLGPLFRASLPVGVSGVLIIAYARLDQVIVYSFAGAKNAGLYGSVYTVLDSTHFIPGSILTTMAPVIAAAWPNDPDRLRRSARMAAELLCVGSFGALAFAIVAADPVVRLIFGAEFAPAAPALPVLGGAFILISFGYLNGNLLLVLGLQNKLMHIGLAALVVNIAGNLILVPKYGFMAAAWMTLVTEAVVFAFASRLVLKKLERPMPKLGRIGRTAGCALLLTGELYLARALGAPLAVLVAIACFSYPTLLFGFGAMSLDDVRLVLGRRREATV
jgi:O-antigen/teichoic acid export membrane protein